MIIKRLGEEEDAVAVDGVRGQIGFAISGRTRSIVINISNS